MKFKLINKSIKFLALVLLLTVTSCQKPSNHDKSDHSNSKKYFIGGVVSGLSGQLLIADEKLGTLVLNQNGSFQFQLQLSNNSKYHITVLSNPDSQFCRVSNSEGTIVHSDVNNVKITCNLGKASIQDEKSVAIHVAFGTGQGMNRCLKSNGAQVEATYCAYGNPPEQNWVFENNQIKNNGKCLEIIDSSINPDPRQTTVSLNACSSTNDKQLWLYEETTNQIRSKIDPSLCLKANIGFNYSSVQMSQCESLPITPKDNNQQQWVLTKALPFDNLVAWYKPTYHFSKKVSSMPFDPDGSFYYNGEYHMMYIYQDGRGHEWGHVTSNDLFHWKDQQPSLTDGHNFSGNAFFTSNGTPAIMHMNTGMNANAIAVPNKNSLDDSWLTPKEYTPFTIFGALPPGFYSWDPYAWYDTSLSTYFSVFGGPFPTLFSSSNLTNWQYEKKLISDSDITTFGLNEKISCPKFFPLGKNNQIFMYLSEPNGTRFLTGEWDASSRTFTPKNSYNLDQPGGILFAPDTFEDGKGRRIVWAWLLEPRMDLAGGLGVISMPRVYSFDNDKIFVKPPEEIKSLRSNYYQEKNIMIHDTGEQQIKSINSDTLEIKVEMNLSDTDRAGIKVLQSPNHQEETVIYYDKNSGMLNLDVSKSSLDNNAYYGWGSTFMPWNNSFTFPQKLVQSVPLVLDNHNTLKLDIFIDRSVIEVFANDSEVLTNRVYPSLDTSTQVSLFNIGKTLKVDSFESWDISL